MKFSRAIALLTLLFLTAASPGAWACVACYDPAGSAKMNHAAAIGIAAMVVFMFVMLGTLFAAGWHLVWRAKHPLPDYDELLAEDPTTPGDSTPKS
jgi:hypothetical protein